MQFNEDKGYQFQFGYYTNDPTVSFLNIQLLQLLDLIILQITLKRGSFSILTSSHKTTSNQLYIKNYQQQMLKQKPHQACQSSMLLKKQKKRQSSTSQKKENISVTHNNSIVIQSNHFCEKTHFNNKNIQNSSLIKNKSKKNKITQNRQRSISRMSNQTFSHQLGQNSKVKLLKEKQNQGINNKIRKTKNDLSIIDLQTKRNQLHTKSLMHNVYEPEAKAQKERGKKVRPLSRNEIVKSSTIISSSTGNIQFSDRSKEEDKEKTLQFSQKDQFNVSRIPLQPKKRQIVTYTKSFQSKKYKLNATRAAIMIQKTWRGYLTRKLLEEYIESFQPLYQEQLKEIRSGRQSRRQIKSNHNRNQKSSFFESSEIEEYSQIKPFEEEKRATQKLNVKENDKRSDVNSQLSVIQQNSQVVSRDSKRSETSFRGESTNRRENCDMPVQYFRKGKKQTKDQMSPNVEQASPSTFHKNKIAQNLSVSKISEFTIKNNAKAEGPSLRQNSVNQSTIKLNNQKRQLTLSSKITCLTVLPVNFKSISGHLQGLELYCASLERLFSSFNVECVGDLKTEIKLNNLELSELKERKQALKDIVENGKDFVKNVQDEIGKALKQMKRIVKQGCQNEGDQRHTQTERSHNKENQHHNKKRAVIRGEKSNDKSPYQDMDSQNSDQVCQSSKKSHSAKRRHRNILNCPSQFQKIQLPTEEYSIKGGSPIQEDFDEEASYDEDQSMDRGKDYQQHEQQNEHGLERRVNQQSVEILNQFLINLIEEFSQITETRNVAELEYLCETLKRVSCESQNKTIIDRCLIEFIVQIMSETWTFNEIYEGFKHIVTKNIKRQNDSGHVDQIETSDSWKLYQMIRRWLMELQKWEMNIIQEVPSKMESSSFMHTENISVQDLRDAVGSISNCSQDFDNSR